MFYIILTSIALFIINIGLGNLYQKILCVKPKNISIDIIYSIIVTTIIWTVCSFIIPINQALEIIFTAIGIFSFIHFRCYKKVYSFLKTRGLYFYLIFLIIIYSGSFGPFIYDHFGYYLPTIKWLTEFGTIKGLANLELSQAQASFWHIYQAGFSSFIDPFLRINVFLLLTFIIYSFETRRWILLAFTPLFLIFTQSPSPDLAVYCLTLITLNELFNYQKNAKFIFALSIFVFIIKPTVFWLPLFAGLYYLWFKKRNISFSVYGILILCLYMFKNIWIFGYPIFPLPVIDLGLPWTPHPEILNISSANGILKTFDFQYTLIEIQNFSNSDYFINWLTLEGIKSKINILVLLSLFALGIFAIIKNKSIYYLLLITMLIKIVIVIAISGQYRFLIDIPIVLIFLIFYKTWYSFSKIITLTSCLLVGIVFFKPALVMVHLPSFRIGKMMQNFKIKQFEKPVYFKINKYSNHKIGNLNFNVVNGYPFSYDTQLPAITPLQLSYFYKIGIFPQLRKQRIEQGFTWKILTKEEKASLHKLISTK